MIEKLKQTPALFASAFLVYLVCAVFYPILESDFLYIDVRDQVVENPHIQGLTLQNLKFIFTSRWITSYYPIRSLTYAIDYQIWGLRATGFKLTNGLLHLTNVLLLFWLLLRLLRRPVLDNRAYEKWWDTIVAAFAAGVFAVHPVVVEPVAWVAGREELLMMLGFLGCTHCHLSARRAQTDEANRGKVFAYHAGATVFCALACLSNAVAAVIPAVMTAWDLLTLKSPRLGKILRGTIALWLLGVVTIFIKVLGPETTLVDRTALLPLQRLGVILKICWLNLKTFLWPAKLAFHYPDVTPDSLTDAGVILGALAICLACAALWVCRRRKLVLFGLIWCGIALAPSAQIMPHHIQRADRLLYLPLAGLVIAMAAGLRPLKDLLRSRGAVATAIVTGVACLLVLDTLGVRQVRTWQDDVSVWENCVRISPDDAVARCTLADSLAAYGHFDRAIRTYQQAIQLDPERAMPFVNFGWLLATCSEDRLREYHLAVELAERGCELDGGKNPAFRHSLTMVYCSYAEELTRRREFQQAEAYYRKALEVDPDCQQALHQLAELPASGDVSQEHDPNEAAQLPDLQ